MDKRLFLKKAVGFLILMLAFFCFFSGDAYAGKKSKKSSKKPAYYTITPRTKPCRKMYFNSTYGKTTKNSYTIRSYMDKLEKKGGGTLVLKKGTYYLNNTVYISSNVKLVFNDGVVLKKTYKKYYGFSGAFPPSLSMFMLCAPKIATKSYGYKPGKFPKAYKKYNGVHDVKILAKGKCTIDLCNVKDNAKKVGAIGFEMGHNKNIIIDGITFKNCDNGHFIELDAGKNVTVKNCTFKDMRDHKNAKREAINIDNPENRGFTVTWSSYDKTGCSDISIERCIFKDVNAGIGDHNYVKEHPHKNIYVGNCVFDGCYAYGIHAENWKDSEINCCIFKNMPNSENAWIGYPIAGDYMDNLIVDRCEFNNTYCVIRIDKNCNMTPDCLWYTNIYKNVVTDVIDNNGEIWTFDKAKNVFAIAAPKQTPQTETTAATSSAVNVNVPQSAIPKIASDSAINTGM